MTEKFFSAGKTLTRSQIFILIMLSLMSVCLITGGCWYVIQTQSQSLAQANANPVYSTPEVSHTETLIPTSSPIPGILISTITAHTATALPTYTPTPSALPLQGLAPSSTLIPSNTPMPSLTIPPTSTNPETIGYSVKDRPLQVYRFGNGPNERMVVAGIHGGNEYNTIQLADRLIRYYQNHPNKIPGDVTLYILPSLNPDGAARSHDIYGRANENEVDLNHNWPAFWKVDWSRNGCWRYLHLNGGTGPASEPETQALMSFLISHHVQALISYHSAAMGIFPGGIPPTDKSLSLASAVAEVSSYPYPPIQTGCDYCGALVDWASAQGIAALDVELTDHYNTDYQMNLNVVDVLMHWKP